MAEPAVERARVFTHEVVQPSVDAWEASATYPRDAVRAIRVWCGDAALAFSISMHNAIVTAIAGVGVGDDALRERWFEPLVAGKELGGPTSPSRTPASTRPRSRPSEQCSRSSTAPPESSAS